ncbi:hypothetical protein [uncultured Allomuricauda sp.]|uniref:hypothetical protein n=1 Tax=Flagellimonas sp. W118 TaxID=3410791 RepID=UPI002603C1A9|nr:hypothetical protein [uncultured Allomuricauda sp.]
MTYKIKSFLYFLCFAIAAYIYNNIQQQEERFQDQVSSTSLVETDFEDSDELEDTQENLVEDSE